MGGGHGRVRAARVPEARYEAVAQEFGPAEIGALVALITAINAWNRIGVATRAWQPGSYRP
jgi:alkylhydroperoxidase family enzyme